MSVTIDHEPLAAESLGLATVGQVLSHASRGNRLVVNLLIDGTAPDLDRMADVRRAPILGKTLFIETADPRGMACDVLTEVEAQMRQADKLAGDCADYFRRDQASDALQRLGGCFTIWQHAQQSVLKTAQLLRLDLTRIIVGDRAFSDIIADFTAQLRLIKTSLEDHDYAGLGDVLTYETPAVTQQWQDALVELRKVIRGDFSNAA